MNDCDWCGKPMRASVVCSFGTICDLGPRSCYALYSRGADNMKERLCIEAAPHINALLDRCDDTESLGRVMRLRKMLRVTKGSGE